MNSLPIKDDMFILGMLSNIHNDPKGWEKLMEALRSQFNLNSCNLIVTNNTSFAIRFQVGAGWFPDDEMASLYVNEYAQQDPILIKLQTSEIGKVYATNLVHEEINVYDTDYYLKWAKPQGIIEGAAAYLSVDKDWSTALLTNRKEEQGKYTLQEVERLNALLPYIDDALKKSFVIAQDTISNLRLKSVVNQYRLPVAILNEYGEVTALNKMMQLYINDKKTLKIKENTLHFNDKEKDKKLSLSILSSSKRIAGVDIVVDEGSRFILNDNETLAFEELIEHDGEKDIFLGTFVYIVSQNYVSVVDKKQLHHIFSLTPAETDVCSFIVEGKRPKEIALILDKSIYTVREQINNIYAKTGCNSQISLINFLSSIPAFNFNKNC
ncbi:helix-turn-helix transcriptional regulator [Parashewanella curva]|uniref:Helix-turn-helix transcriptional regulator n=1 Tax=Parashewanella curva TaxID=2338552 RepID=A0A3L8PVR0_9GAMM|nr:helix-turn-helix transcriptional regulator [Parashewanella curva]RLV58142.1 helix-turn-helix transcriptional regulator [Parashewanella curva]